MATEQEIHDRATALVKDHLFEDISGNYAISYTPLDPLTVVLFALAKLSLKVDELEARPSRCRCRCGAQK